MSLLADLTTSLKQYVDGWSISKPYEYRPLPSPRFIRVLWLYPAEKSSAAISCDLQDVSLDEETHYDALSYAWDGQELSSPIECAGRLLLTTPNCASALRQLRDDTRDRVVWVDSLCINQASIADRNQQVALMGEIYKKANMVIAWLGESDSASTKAYERLKELADKMQEQDPPKRNDRNFDWGQVEALQKRKRRP